MLHLVDTTMFFAPQSGGVKRYLLQKQIALRGHMRHTLLVPGPHNSALTQDCVTLRSPRIPGGHGYRLPLWRQPWTATLKALQPDLIEFADPYQPAWAALDVGQALGVPVIGFYHSDLVRLAQDRCGHHASRLAAAYVRRLYSQCDLVLTPSEVMATQLRALNIPRVYTQALGVDSDIFHPRQRDPELRQSLGLAPQTRLLIYAGRFSREKCLPLLFEAMRQLGPDYHLLLVGAGMALPKQDRISIHPYQSDTSALARLLASCDLFVHPGDQETFGLTVLEAMSCGIPAVGMAAGGVAALIDPTCGALVPPNRPDALAQAVRQLMQADRTQLRRQAREKVLLRYQWGPIFTQLLKRYADLAT